MPYRYLFCVAAAALTVSCGPEAQGPVPPPQATAAPIAPTPTPTAAPAAPPKEAAELAFPAQLQGKAALVHKGDPDEARADLASAVKPPGDGGISQGLVVRLTADVPVWRMWNGPAKKDGQGHTNRLGQWWSYDAPHGTQTEYRIDYEICKTWNDLTYVARCTLKKGAVVAIGPGNSVSPKTCNDATGAVAYPAAPNDWQVWVSKVWARPTELECPPDTSDYEADPADISRPKHK